MKDQLVLSLCWLVGASGRASKSLLDGMHVVIRRAYTSAHGEHALNKHCDANGYATLHHAYRTCRRGRCTDLIHRAEDPTATLLQWCG